MKHVNLKLIKRIDDKLQYVEVAVPKWYVIQYGVAYVVKKLSDNQ